MPFINLCARGTTHWPTNQLLRYIQQLEINIGRQRNRPHWSPRTIDIDILMSYTKHHRNNKKLTLPHPEMGQRAFVLIPLSDVKHGYTNIPTKYQLYHMQQHVIRHQQRLRP